MLCDICQKNQAIINLNNFGIPDGEGLNICMDCLLEQNREFLEKYPQMAEMTRKFMEAAINCDALDALPLPAEIKKLSGTSNNAIITCSGCNKYFTEIAGIKTISCPQCIVDFKENLLAALTPEDTELWNDIDRQEDGTDSFRLTPLAEGFKPDDYNAYIQDAQHEVERLKKELEAAVQVENYDRAARIRDLIAEFDFDTEVDNEQ